MSRPEKIYILEPTSSIKTSTLARDLTSQSLCRICASNTKLVLPIFEKEGLENNLAEKITKYLPVQVSQDDLLPKVVCFQCTTTILTWHELVTTCQEADTSLRKQVSFGIVNKCSEHKPADNTNKLKTTVSFIEAVKEIILSIFSSVMVEEDCVIEFICQKCNNQQFQYIEDLSEHLMIVHILQTCSSTTIETFIKDHIKFEENISIDVDDVSCNVSRTKSTSAATYSCKQCERRFTSTRRLIGHLHEHTAIDFQTGVICCGRRHHQRDDLARHLAADHRAAVADTACRSCGHLAPDAAALRAHVLADHASVEPKPRPLGRNNQKRIPASCPHCNRTFSNKYNMAAHARAHSAEETQEPRDHPRHACLACGRRYSTRGNLAAHVRAAHEAPARACPACGELFARPADLRRHEARHGPPALRCAACPAAFHHADSLRRHALAHRDVRPHACPRCGRAFRQRSHLAAHRASHACRLLQGDSAA